MAPRKAFQVLGRSDQRPATGDQEANRCRTYGAHGFGGWVPSPHGLG